MIRLFGLWVVGCALCVTPVAADEDMYDGPTAIKPLTVKPQPQHSVPPNTVCDFEHQCYPEKGGPAAAAPAAPPAIVVKPIAPRPQVPDEPVVATWRDCMDGALQTYEQSHNLHALQMATGSCQAQLEEQDGEEYDGEDYGVADGGTTARQNPRSRCRQLRGWLHGATSVAAGGPSAAMPTATARRGVGASDSGGWGQVEQWQPRSPLVDLKGGLPGLPAQGRLPPHAPCREIRPRNRPPRSPRSILLRLHSGGRRRGASTAYCPTSAPLRQREVFK